MTHSLFVCDGFFWWMLFLYRWGTCHVINNLYTNWGYYALGARVHAKIISESNVFVPSRRMEVTPWFKGAGPDFDQSASIISFNDLLTNGCTFHQSLVYNPSMSMHPSYPPTARYPPITPTSQLSLLVKTCSGALFGPNLKLCLSHSRTNWCTTHSPPHLQLPVCFDLAWYGKLRSKLSLKLVSNRV